jgi:hypothetical protein
MEPGTPLSRFCEPLVLIRGSYCEQAWLMPRARKDDLPENRLLCGKQNRKKRPTSGMCIPNLNASGVLFVRY